MTHDRREARRRRRRRPRPAGEREGDARPGPEPARSGPPAPSRWTHPERLLPIAATVLMVGLALVGLGPSVAGAGLSLLGAAAFLYAIHRYGRLGPDEGSPDAS